MHSPRGGGVGEAKPWLSSGSPLDTFCLLPAVNSRAGKFADAPAEQFGEARLLAGQCLTPVGVSFVLLVAIASSDLPRFDKRCIPRSEA